MKSSVDRFVDIIKKHETRRTTNYLLRAKILLFVVTACALIILLVVGRIVLASVNGEALLAIAAVIGLSLAILFTAVRRMVRGGPGGGKPIFTPWADVLIDVVVHTILFCSLALLVICLFVVR